MNDDNRNELRTGISGLVRSAMAGNTVEYTALLDGSYRTVSANGRLDDGQQPPALTPAQQLALSVLLGEPDTVIESALCDLLLDQGHDYATACYEKGVADATAVTLSSGRVSGSVGSIASADDLAALIRSLGEAT